MWFVEAGGILVYGLSGSLKTKEVGHFSIDGVIVDHFRNRHRAIRVNNLVAARRHTHFSRSWFHV